MGLRDDLERYRTVGEQRRQDLADFIRHGDLTAGSIRVPVKTVELPEFVYDDRERGGVGQAGSGGRPRPGDRVAPGDGNGDGDGDGDGEGDGDEAGEGSGEHGYYEMDPEEFAEELDDRLGLDLEPKGKQVVEEREGPYTDIARTGPSSTLDFEHLFKSGLKRKLAVDFDEEYVTEALKVAGWGPAEAFRWARAERVPVSLAWLADRYDRLDADERETWPSIEAMEASVERTTTAQRLRRDGLERVPLRHEDERYRHAETVEEPAYNVVVVNIRDVSGSMREEKRELVERTFTPLDWYLQGKYDRAEFRYVAHDAEAWEVDREEFFGIQSGGGTRVSTAYELAAELLEEYPASEWNRYVFAAGDGENAHGDTKNHVVPLIEGMDANLHAYVETRPDGRGRGASHGAELERAFVDADDVAVTRVGDRDDVLDAIEEILTTETDDD